MNKSICEAERLVALNALCESGRARKIRQASRLPLVVIARSVGAHESTIGRWERGERFPTPGATADAYLDLLRKLDKP